MCSTRIPEAGAGLCVPHDPPPPPAVSSEKRQGSGVNRGGPGKPPRAMGALRGDVPSAALGGTGLPHQWGGAPLPSTAAAGPEPRKVSKVTALPPRGDVSLPTPVHSAITLWDDIGSPY